MGGLCLCVWLTGSSGLAPGDNGLRLGCYRCQNKDGRRQDRRVTLVARVCVNNPMKLFVSPAGCRVDTDVSRTTRKNLLYYTITITSSVLVLTLQCFPSMYNSKLCHPFSTLRSTQLPFATKALDINNSQKSTLRFSVEAFTICTLQCSCLDT